MGKKPVGAFLVSSLIQFADKCGFAGTIPVFKAQRTTIIKLDVNAAFVEFFIADVGHNSD